VGETDWSKEHGKDRKMNNRKQVAVRDRFRDGGK